MSVTVLWHGYAMTGRVLHRRASGMLDVKLSNGRTVRVSADRVEPTTTA